MTSWCFCSTIYVLLVTGVFLYIVIGSVCVAHFSLKVKPKRKVVLFMKSVLIALIKAMFGGFTINAGDISFNKIIVIK